MKKQFFYLIMLCALQVQVHAVLGIVNFGLSGNLDDDDMRDFPTTAATVTLEQFAAQNDLNAEVHPELVDTFRGARVRRPSQTLSSADAYKAEIKKYGRTPYGLCMARNAANSAACNAGEVCSTLVEDCNETFGNPAKGPGGGGGTTEEHVHTFCGTSVTPPSQPLPQADVYTQAYNEALKNGYSTYCATCFANNAQNTTTGSTAFEDCNTCYEQQYGAEPTSLLEGS